MGRGSARVRTVEGLGLRMSNGRGLAAVGIVVVLVGAVLGGVLWPEQRQVQQTAVLVAAQKIPRGSTVTDAVVVTAVIEGPVTVPVMVSVGAAESLVAMVDIPGGTVLHQGLFASADDVSAAAGRATVEMDSELLPLRATAGSWVRLMEVASAETEGLLEACGRYLFELQRVSVELTGLPEEVPVAGSASACEAAGSSWSLPDRVGEGPLVGGRDCSVESGAEVDATVSRRFARVADLSAATAERAVAAAEAGADVVGNEDAVADRRAALAAVSAELADLALADLQQRWLEGSWEESAELARAARDLIEQAEADRAAAVGSVTDVAQIEDALLEVAREKSVESAVDEVAAVPHRCVEEDPVPWPAGIGSIDVEVLAVRGDVAEIAVDSAHVTGVIEALREGRVVAYTASTSP